MSAVRKATCYADDRLREWARAMEKPLHAVGYPPVSQMHRVCHEGAEGMLAKGPIGDGGMYQAIRHMRYHIHAEEKVRQISRIVSQMPRYLRDVVRVTYLANPGNVTPRRTAAKELGLKELHYRDRLIVVHGYVQGVLDAE